MSEQPRRMKEVRKTLCAASFLCATELVYSSAIFAENGARATSWWDWVPSGWTFHRA